MDLTEKLNLVGYAEGESKQLKSIDEVADFICQNGKHGDVTIMNNNEPFITTIGIYLDKVADIRYRAQLMPILTKKQKQIFLKYVQNYLSPQDYAKTLAECWIREEQPNMNPSITKTELTNMFKRADKEFLMSETEYKKWQDLPEKLTIYRGVTEYNGKNIRALSWTTNYDTAKWFAGRYGEKGKVYQAEIDKKHILACIDQRGESEIIVEPKYLKDIELVEDLSLSITIQQ